MKIFPSFDIHSKQVLQMVLYLADDVIALLKKGQSVVISADNFEPQDLLRMAPTVHPTAQLTIKAGNTHPAVLLDVIERARPGRITIDVSKE